MVQEAVHDWTGHIGENVLSDEIYRVFNDNNAEVDELVHHKSGDRVIVIEVGLTKVNVSAVNYWVKVTMLVQDKVGLEVKLEVLEDQLDVAIVREEPEVNILLGIDLPVFDCWEFDTDESLVEGAGQLYLDVSNIEIGVGVFNVLPVNLPLEQVEEKTELIVVMFW